MLVSIIVIYVLGIFMYVPWSCYKFADGEYNQDIMMLHVCFMPWIWPLFMPFYWTHMFWKWWFTTPINRYQGRMK